MSKKIYFVAVNWDMVKSEDKHKYVITTEARDGNDIAGFTECYKYKDGWRIYPFTTKKAQQELVDNTLRGKGGENE